MVGTGARVGAIEVTVVIPVRNGGRHFQRLTRHLQELTGRMPEVEVLVIDSGSDDGTPELAEEAGFRVHRIAPAEFAELRAQLATFDVVAPRLALLFEVMDRGLHGEPLGEHPRSDRASTAPFPDWLDADRGSEPTMVAAADLDGAVAETAAEIRQFHGLGEGLPSVYRCLAQWPGYLSRAWADLEAVLDGEGFETAVEEANRLVAGYVDEIPYSPRIGPDDLRDQGFDDDLIDDVQALFSEFNTGAIETVIPALPVFAKTLDVEGERTLL